MILVIAAPPPPAPENAWALSHVRVLAQSFQRLIGRALSPTTDYDAAWAQELFNADFALLSHGLEIDPLFNYANRCALRLFELDWPTLTVTPSRASAEAGLQSEREKFMAAVKQHGYADNYTGVRISAQGRRFSINDAVVWNVIDEHGNFHGQAATFASWDFID